MLGSKQKIFAMLLAMLSAASISNAQARRINRHPAGGVALPYQVSDGHGAMWIVYQPTTIQMQGNMPLYQQAGFIMINGNQPAAPGQVAARMDDKTGEVIFDNMQVAGLTMARRILFNPDEGYARVIDLIKNPQPQDQQVTVQLQSFINFGVQSSQTVPDPKKKTQNLGWVATTAAGNNKAVTEVFASSGSKLYPTIENTQGNNSVNASFVTTIPAGKEIAIAHFHMTSATQDQGVSWITNMKPAKLFADVPKEIRPEIVNFRVTSGIAGDLEILRGDTFDVVELRSGDKFNGNLQESSYKLDTFYGLVELPTDKVVCIINQGQFKPRQLIVTSDGQIFGGHLQKPTIQLELSSGQKTEIPLAQISRLGYHHRPDEKEDNLDQPLLQFPYLLMTAGDRISVAAPLTPIAVVTRYGQLQLSPNIIASIIFNSEDSGVHTIELNDGSRFNGLVIQNEFATKLTAGANNPDVKFPIGTLSRIVFANAADDKNDSLPLLQLKKDDLLIGTLQGELKLDTAFDSIALHAPEIRAISHAKESISDLSVTTWDGTVFSGQLEQQEVQCHLKSGIDIQIPIGLIESYNNPSAAVPVMILEKIKGMVGDLNADDWKQRDAAEHQLVKIGLGVIATLKQMRDKQPPEAQQRIDSILKQLQK